MDPPVSWSFKWSVLTKAPIVFMGVRQLSTAGWGQRSLVSISWTDSMSVSLWNWSPPPVKGQGGPGEECGTACGLTRRHVDTRWKQSLCLRWGHFWTTRCVLIKIIWNLWSETQVLRIWWWSSNTPPSNKEGGGLQISPRNQKPEPWHVLPTNISLTLWGLVTACSYKWYNKITLCV